MTIQLIAVGYALVLIFENPSPWASALIVLVMLALAGWIAVRPLRRKREYLGIAILSLGLSVGLHLAIALLLVLRVDSWFEPDLLIPLAGMFFANTMNTLSLAAERYEAELDRQVSSLEARGDAFQAAMIPQVNSLLAVGLVALPGMMTGQILSGVSPLIAVRYQIMIMAMILGTSGSGAAMMLWLFEKKLPR